MCKEHRSDGTRKNICSFHCALDFYEKGVKTAVLLSRSKLDGTEVSISPFEENSFI